MQEDARLISFDGSQELPIMNKIRSWRWLIPVLAILAIGFYHTRRSSAIPSTVTGYFLSPDGKWCVVTVEEDNAPLGLISTDGKDGVQRLAGTERASDLAWSPDSQSIYFTYSPGTKSSDQSSIRLKSVFTDLQPSVVVESTSGDETVHHTSPSPDGALLAYVRTGYVGSSRAFDDLKDVVHVRDLKTGSDVALTNYPLPFLSTSIQWSADSRILIFRGGGDTTLQAYKKNTQGSGLVLCYPQEKFRTQLVAYNFDYFALSPDSKFIALRGILDKKRAANAIVIGDLTGTELRRVQIAQVAPNMVWSADNRFLFIVDHLFAKPQLSRLDVQSGEIKVIVPSNGRKAIALIGRHDDTLFYSVAIDRNHSLLHSLSIKDK